MANCDICDYKINLKSRALIICPNCEFECCKQCFVRYIFEAPHYMECMSCRKEINYGYANWALGHGYKTKLALIAGETMYQSEQAFFKETQSKIEIRNLNSERKKLKSEQTHAETRDERRELAMQLFEIEEDLKDIKIGNNRKSIICTNPDCNGYSIINGSGIATCGLCKWQSCEGCEMRVENGLDNHKCDPKILENVKEIALSTKECPVCKTRIARIHGCNQMFCTHCLTLFDWETMMIERGWRHNPDYLKWLDANPNRKSEINAKAGDEVHIFDLNMFINNLHIMYNALCKQYPLREHCPEYLKTKEEKAAFDLTLATHVANREWISSLCEDLFDMFKPEIVTYSALTNQNSRVRFLSNQMTELSFKKKIGQNAILSKHVNDIIECLNPLYEFARNYDNIRRTTTIENYLDITKSESEMNDLYDIARSQTYEVEKKWKASAYSDAQIAWNYTAPYIEDGKILFVARGKTIRFYTNDPKDQHYIQGYVSTIKYVNREELPPRYE
jgi:hypothetical protein